MLGLQQPLGEVGRAHGGCNSARFLEHAVAYGVSVARRTSCARTGMAWPNLGRCLVILIGFLSLSRIANRRVSATLGEKRYTVTGMVERDGEFLRNCPFLTPLEASLVW